MPPLLRQLPLLRPPAALANLGAGPPRPLLTLAIPSSPLSSSPPMLKDCAWRITNELLASARPSQASILRHDLLKRFAKSAPVFLSESAWAWGLGGRASGAW